MVSGSLDNNLRIWDLERGMKLFRFSAESPINSLALEQNGRNLVAGDVGGNV